MRQYSLAKFAIVIFVVALILSIWLKIDILISNNGLHSMDSVVHYHLMKSSYDNKIYPVLGSYLDDVDSISKDNANIARTPGGFFVIEYMMHYILGAKDHYRARISYSIVMFVCALIFLLWIYIRFGIITASIISVLILVNSNFIFNSTNFYNANTNLMLSFLFLPLFAEYVRDKYESLVASVLLFPILALMWQGHFSVFFSIVMTLIVYLAINWEKKTKYNIKGLGIGIAVSFCTYIPYLSSEIKHGFSNTKLILARKVVVTKSLDSIITPPHLHNILIFPTNESNMPYTSLDNFLSYWLFNSNTLLKVVFIFYILSILFMLMAIIVSFKDYFRNRNSIIKPISNNDKNKNMLKEMFLFFMLYFVVTFASYNIFGIGGGQAHYFYNAYTISFIPIIYFIEYLKLYRSRLLKYIMIFTFLNAFALSTIVHIQNQSGNAYGNFDLIGKALKEIVDDSNNRAFHLEAKPIVNEIGKAYFGTENWNATPDNNIWLKYTFINANVSYSPSANEELLFESMYHKIYKNSATSNN